MHMTNGYEVTNWRLKVYDQWICNTHQITCAKIYQKQERTETINHLSRTEVAKFIVQNTASTLAVESVATDSCHLIWPTGIARCRDWLTDR